MIEAIGLQTAARDPLSDREREIVERAANGLTDKEIAKDLGIATGTVKTHWTRVRTRFRCSTRAHAVALFMRGPGNGAAFSVNMSRDGNGHGIIAQTTSPPETEMLGTIRGVFDDRSVVLEIDEMTGLADAVHPETLIGRPLSELPGLRQVASAIELSNAGALRKKTEVRGCVSIEVGRERARVVFRISPPNPKQRSIKGLRFLVTVYRYSREPVSWSEL